MEQARARIKIIHIDFIKLNYSISFQKVKYFLCIFYEHFL